MDRDLEEKEAALDVINAEKRRFEIEHDDVTKHLSKNYDIPNKLRYININYHFNK